jgi:hypothetical protein
MGKLDELTASGLLTANSLSLSRSPCRRVHLDRRTPWKSGDLSDCLRLSTWELSICRLEVKLRNMMNQLKMYFLDPAH